MGAIVNLRADLTQAMWDRGGTDEITWPDEILDTVLGWLDANPDTIAEASYKLHGPATQRVNPTKDDLVREEAHHIKRLVAVLRSVDG